MAKNRGWWSLKLEGNQAEDLSEADKSHIAQMIIQGYEGGEIVQDEGEEE